MFTVRQNSNIKLNSSSFIIDAEYYNIARYDDDALYNHAKVVSSPRLS